MSNASPEMILALEFGIFQQGYTYAYCYLATTALIFYEYIVTFPQEVHVIWGARLTTVTVIFAINRYMLMVEGISMALYVMWWYTPLSCDAVNVLNKVTSVVLQVVTANFAAYRTYAISGHQIVPALLVLLLGLVPVGFQTWLFVYAYGSYNFVADVGSYPICSYYGSFPYVGVDGPLAAGICPAISDLIVVLVTWYKTFRLAIEVRKLRLKGSIVTMLMRDGTLHFTALLLLNIFNINSETSESQYSASAAIFLLPMTSILVSRFILNLRQVSLGSVGLNTMSHSTLNTPDIPSRLVGNFGAELQHTSLVFENVEDSIEDEQSISVDSETYELGQVQ